jgi:hypothetical protein
MPPAIISALLAHGGQGCAPGGTAFVRVLLLGDPVAVKAEGIRAGRESEPAVAVPLGPAVTQPDAVHHSRAQEPVVIGVVQAHRVGPVTQVTPAEFGRNLAGN